MRNSMPDGHNLPVDVISNAKLVYRDADNNPSLTDIQYEALKAGVANGKSLLVVAPTSTGKTNIALWAVLSWLGTATVADRSAVYLVTHRALARQKFDEFQDLLRDAHFNGDPSAIVFATGDGVVDGSGVPPQNPLSTPLLVATYEKYLAMLAGSGMRADMTKTLVVCDEVQIVGDEHRGRNVEILLTLLRQTKFGQFVGLSAVIDQKDAVDLSDWLGIALIRLPSREKHLTYECRTPSKRLIFDTENIASGISHMSSEKGAKVTSIDALCELYADKRNRPIVVFCMSRNRVYDGIKEFAGRIGLLLDKNVSLFSGLVEDTTAARDLSQYLNHRVAFHTADLLEEERQLVERKLEQREIDVVFSTTTLAAGVNFPFQTALFDEWRRYDGKSTSPIPNSEFQNMAGRAGRMGLAVEKGRVVFFAQDNFNDARVVESYLDPDALPVLNAQVSPESFEQISLQIIAAGICQNRGELDQFLLSTFSAHREMAINAAGLSHWEARATDALQRLRDWGFVL